MESWDWVTGSRVAGEGLLSVEMGAGTGRITTDLIDARDGTVLKTLYHGLRGQQIIATVPLSRRVLMNSFVPSDSALITIVIYPLSTL
ncbi:MAG: hypothetical protein OXM02_05825 [Bacteroidota bacterium]|nr:hypothetical protein [Bacteroidota bacterium]